MTATVSAEWAMTIQRHAASFKEGTARPLKAFQRMLGLMAGCWDAAHKRKVVTTDASNKGWGALCEGKQSALTEGDACAGQNEPRSRHVVKEICLFRGLDTPPACGSENLGILWQGSSRTLCLQRQLSLPNLFYKEHGCPGPRMAQPSALWFPPSRSATAGTQGATAQADFQAPIAGRSVGRDCVVIQFLRGARRMNLPRSRTVPPWDLSTVLKALEGPPFEPLQSSSLRVLLLKTALLLTLASVKQVGDLQLCSTGQRSTVQRDSELGVRGPEGLS